MLLLLAVTDIFRVSGFNFRLALSRLSKTLSTLSMCSLTVEPYTITSSRYIKHISHWRPWSTSSIRRWNVAGAQERPNDFVKNSYKPYFVANAVLGMLLSSIGTWWYPDVKSKVEKYLDPATASRQSCTLGKGKASCLVTLLSFR